MEEYPKIQSIFKRDEKTHKFIIGNWALPEFKYLKDNIWVWTEKVDGTNIRVVWYPERPHDLGSQGSHASVEFRGKTNNAQVTPFLLEKLRERFTVDKLKLVFPDTPVCLYGEGHGARIQKGGGNYIPSGVDFILIDVKIDRWWLKRDGIEDIASKLEIKAVPIVGEGTLEEAINLTRTRFRSTWGDFNAEGLVLKPKVDLVMRSGERVITKMKTKGDFR